jgi:hypothetical protein
MLLSLTEHTVTHSGARGQSQTWLIHDFLWGYLLLNRSFDPPLLLIIALASSLLLWVVRQLGSCYPVLSDRYPYLCLVLISCGFSSSFSLDLLSFLTEVLSDIPLNYSCCDLWSVVS